MSVSKRRGSRGIDSGADSGSAEPPAAEPEEEAMQTLDVKSFNCPMPVLKAKVALAGLEPGQLLRVLATDPHSVADFEAFCKKTGHVLLKSSEADGVYEFVLRRHA